MRIRVMALMAVLVMLMGMAVSGSAEAEDYQNTYVNTGDQRADIIGVALTQLGYKEGENNASKYGSWLGYPNAAWCASFIGWCAVQADISEDILEQTSWVSVSSFGVTVYEDNYTPQPGDLFFKKDYSHVGLVYYVEGDSFYTIEGNSDVLGSTEGYYVISNKRLLADCNFGVPDYKGAGDCNGAGGHTYEKHTEQSHPHKDYYECTACGDKYYTGFTGFEVECGQCLNCDCSTEYAGYYQCVGVDSALNIRRGPGTNYEKIGGVHAGDVVYVYAADGNWAHIEYDGIRGCVAMRYLEAYIPPEPEPTEPEPTKPESTEPEPTEPHEHVYSEGTDKHYHRCECGEVYEVDRAECVICGPVEEPRSFPWWILCIAEGIVIVVLLILPQLQNKKKRKAKYLH